MCVFLSVPLGMTTGRNEGKDVVTHGWFQEVFILSRTGYDTRFCALSFLSLSPSVLSLSPSSLLYLTLKEMDEKGSSSFSLSLPPFLSSFFFLSFHRIHPFLHPSFCRSGINTHRCCFPYLFFAENVSFSPSSLSPSSLVQSQSIPGLPCNQVVCTNNE